MFEFLIAARFADLVVSLPYQFARDTLKAHMDAAKSEIHIVSVKMGKEGMKETKKKDEMKY